MTRVRAAGDAAVLVAAAGTAGRLAAAILARQPPGVLDAVPGAGTVLVIVEPGSWDLAALARWILSLPAEAAGSASPALAEIPVVYDGPDLADVASLTGLDVTAVMTRHAAAEYAVGWLGFTPGFGYLTGLDPALAAVPRLAEPRVRVPAGSVAIAGGLAAVYPSASPGGWRLLGRTSARLWDPSREPPALLAPGMRVRFRPAARLPVPLAPEPPDGGQPDGGRPEAGTPEAGPPAPVRHGSAIEVIRPGPLATIQDLGRPGLGHLGVPPCGAADSGSLRLANRLAGNADGAAAIEVTLGRVALRAAGELWLAVAGAPVSITVTAGSGHRRQIGMGAAFGVPAGALVQLGAPVTGLRTYIAARGGIDVPQVLGSRSADLVSGLGPPRLREGDVLPVGATTAGGGLLAGGGLPAGGGLATGDAAAGDAAAAGRAAGGMAAAGRAARGSGAGGPVALTVIPGPREDWFTPGALAALCQAEYTVTPASDRAGLRLDGPALPRARDDELPSEGMVTGALQVPPHGRPILLLADHPVTGGYPVIAVVRSADIGRAAQLRPGQRVRFLAQTRLMVVAAEAG